MASTSIVTTANTLFHPKTPSPTEHLNVLRNPTKFNQYDSAYFSPALGNGSDCWIRHRIGNHRSHAIVACKLKHGFEEIIKLGGPQEAHNLNKAARLIDRFDDLLEKMEDNNRPWVLDWNATKKQVKNLRAELDSMSEVNNDRKVDITEQLEELMRQEGRSLAEYHKLKDAAKSKYWPVGCDSDGESSCLEAKSETANSSESNNSNSNSYTHSLDNSNAEDNDDEEDNKDDHLYSFPVPQTTTTTTTTTTTKEAPQENNNNLDESTIAKILEPSKFDWAAEEEDEMPDNPLVVTQPLSLEENFMDLVDDVFEALLIDIDNARTLMQNYRHEKQIPSPRDLAYELQPSRLPDGNKCHWRVHPLAKSKKNMNPPLTGIPTIRLTTPSGQLCELEETSLGYDGPEWEEHFEYRRLAALEQRDYLQRHETFDDRIKRIEAEAYWRDVEAEDYKREVAERMQSLGYQLTGTMDGGHSSTNEISSEDGHVSQTSPNDRKDDTTSDIASDTASNSGNEQFLNCSESPTLVDAESLQPLGCLHRNTSSVNLIDEDLFSNSSNVSSSSSSITDYNTNDNPLGCLLRNTCSVNLLDQGEHLISDTSNVSSSGSDIFDNNKENNPPPPPPPTPTAKVHQPPSFESITRWNNYRRLLATKVQQITKLSRRTQDLVSTLPSIADEENRKKREKTLKQKTQQCLVSLDLQARLEDKMILDKTTTTPRYISTCPHGPSEIIISPKSPLLKYVMRNTWTLITAPKNVERNFNWHYHANRDVFRGAREKMRSVGYEEMHYRSESSEYRKLYRYMREEVRVQEEERRQALGFMVEDGIWDARWREKYGMGREGKREKRKCDWLADRVENEMFVDVRLCRWRRDEGWEKVRGECEEVGGGK